MMRRRTLSAQLIIGILDERRPTRPYIARPVSIPNRLVFLVMLLWNVGPVVKQVSVGVQMNLVRRVALLLPGGYVWASATG